MILDITILFYLITDELAFVVFGTTRLVSMSSYYKYTRRPRVFTTGS